MDPSALLYTISYYTQDICTRSWADRDTFTSSFPSECLFFSLSNCRHFLYSIMSRRRGKSEYSCLVPHLRENIFIGMMFSVGLYIWHLLCWGTFPLKEKLYYLNFLLSGSITLLPDNISSWYIHLLLKNFVTRKAKIIALIPNPLGYERTLHIAKSNEKQERLFLKNWISNILCQKVTPANLRLN